MAKLVWNGRNRDVSRACSYRGWELRVLRLIFPCKYSLLCLRGRMRLEILSSRIQRAPSLFTLYQVIDQ